MITQDNFYRRYGIRKGSQFQRPPLVSYDLLTFPQQSVFHFLGNSNIDIGPNPSEAYYKLLNHPIYVQHLTDLTSNVGMPRKLPKNLDSAIRKYFNDNKRFKRIIREEAVTRDPQSLLIYNYCFLDDVYAYPKTIYANYNRWMNTVSTMVDTMNASSKSINRNQYLFVNLPTKLPNRAAMMAASENISQASLKIFNSNNALMMLEIWKWMGDNRSKSVFSKLTPEALAKTNIVFVESGRWFSMNLGLVNSWRITPKDESISGYEPIKKGVDSKILANAFLNLMIHLVQIRTGEISDDEDLVDDGVVVVDSDDAEEDKRLKEEHDKGPNDDAESVGESLNNAVGKIEKRIESIEVMTQQADAPVEKTVFVENTLPDTLESGVKKKLDVLANQELISGAQYAHYLKLAETYKTIPAPDGKGTMAEFMKINKADIEMPESPSIPDRETVVDKSMLKSSLLKFDSHYIRKVMQKDVANMVMSVQNAGISVTDYKVEKIDDVMGGLNMYSIKLSPVEGVAGTIRFSLPLVDDDGVYMANGSKYRMRKQKGEVPIRKIAPDSVALSSYYGKCFINRSEKKTHDYARWLQTKIMAMGLDENDDTVSNVNPSDIFDNRIELPRLFTILSQSFRVLNLKVTHENKTYDFELNLDYYSRFDLYSEPIVKLYKENFILGTAKGLYFLLVDGNDFLYIGDRNGKLIEIGDILAVLKIDRREAPMDVAVLRIMGKNIPIGIVLGYELGLDNLLSLLGVTYRTELRGGRKPELQDHEYSITFNDFVLIVEDDDQKANMILAGFNDFHRALKDYSIYEFNKPGVYLNILNTIQINARYLREIDLMYQMFIDPITKELLVEMQEPTTFRGLLLRGCELLLTDSHPDSQDGRYMRIKGYERMSGAVYSELVKAIRAHNSRAGKAKLAIDFNPYAVWKNISTDPSISQVTEINPIDNLKQQEAITFSGTGGRNSRSMTKGSRVFHPNDMGTISESTVDSGDVAINVYSSADPQFKSLRGLSRPYDLSKKDPTPLMSTSALVSPCSDTDDPKRVNFIGIQHAHGIACKGYQINPVRTGYEQIIPQRVGDMFCVSAKMDGIVISANDKGFIVQYADGTTKGFETGRVFGAASGLTLPHDVESLVKEGQKFKHGDILAYNKGFFEKDPLNPKSVVWRSSVIAKTALMENSLTLEDSSAISERLAERLQTKIATPRTLVVRFDQEVSKLVSVGATIEADDILCIIEDQVTANTKLFDEETLQALKSLGAQNVPTAKKKGVIDRIEIYYNGDKEDMSASLRTLANSSDKRIAERHKAQGKPGFTGAITMDNYRVDGEPLALDTAAIEIYITSDVNATNGDKGVIGNQMKTVFGKIISNDTVAEDGTPIDCIFGVTSSLNRVVNSPNLIGTSITLLKVIGKTAAKIYKGNK